MSLEENKAIARRYFEDAPFNPDACDEIFASRFHFHALVHTEVTPQTVESDPESEKAAYKQLAVSWGGWHFSIGELIGEGDRVMVRWTSHGVHQGEFNGLPPTGAHTTNSGINIFRIADGQIVEVWDIFDRLWAWQQLGVLPDLKSAIAKTRESVLARERPIVMKAASKKTASTFNLSQGRLLHQLWFAQGGVLPVLFQQTHANWIVAISSARTPDDIARAIFGHLFEDTGQLLACNRIGLVELLLVLGQQLRQHPVDANGARPFDGVGGQGRRGRCC